MHDLSHLESYLFSLVGFLDIHNPYSVSVEDLPPLFCNYIFVLVA